MKTVFMWLFCLFFEGEEAIRYPKYIQVSESIYASKYELTNLEYQIFLEEVMASNGKISHLLSDSSQWTKKFPYAFTEPIAKYYHYHPAFEDYPATNLSKEAIQAYCKWLTESYHKRKKRKFQKVIYRLPTEKEWIEIASVEEGGKWPWEGETIYAGKEKDEPMANVKIKNLEKDELDYAFDGAFYTAKIGSYPKNEAGFNDVIGNLAEYTSDDKVKGGSWFNTLEECSIDRTQPYQLPDPRVGFRIVMEIIEK